MDHKHEDGSIYAYILEVPNLSTRLELRLSPEEAEKQRGFDPLTLAVPIASLWKLGASTWMDFRLSIRLFLLQFRRG